MTIDTYNGRKFYAVAYREKWEDGEDVESGVCPDLFATREGAMGLARTLAEESQARMVDECGCERDGVPVQRQRDGYTVSDRAMGVSAEYWIAPMTLKDGEDAE